MSAAVVERIELSESDSRSVLAEQRKQDAVAMWNAMQVTKRAARCGDPLGGPFRFNERGKRIIERGTCETCGDAACPGCGDRVALRRFGLTGLALAAHEADGGQVVFMSVAGQHTVFDAIEDTAGRLRLFMTVLGSSAFKRLRGELGIVGMVKRVEPTFGGVNGCHPNAHVALLLDGEWDDLDERAAHVRARLVTGWAEWANGGVKMTGAHPDRWPVWIKFASAEAVHVRAGGVAAASYLAKLLPDPGEIGGLAFELTDPSGRKSSTGGVGDRAAAAWCAEQARAAGYGPRRFRAAIVELPHVRVVVEQFRQWRAATAGWHLFSPSRGLFARWADWTDEQILAAASDVVSAEDWEKVLRILGVAGEPEDPEEPEDGEDGEEPEDGEGEVPTDAIGGPFDPAARERDREHSWYDPEAVWAWWAENADEKIIGGVFGALGRMIALDGPWRAVAAVAAACRRAELPMVVLEREGDPDDPHNPPVLSIVDQAEAEAQTGPGSPWARLDDLALGRMAKRSPAWRLADPAVETADAR